MNLGSNLSLNLRSNLSLNLRSNLSLNLRSNLLCNQCISIPNAVHRLPPILVVRKTVVYQFFFYSQLRSSTFVSCNLKFNLEFDHKFELKFNLVTINLTITLSVGNHTRTCKILFLTKISFMIIHVVEIFHRTEDKVPEKHRRSISTKNWPFFYKKKSKLTWRTKILFYLKKISNFW